ncbi:hypothetical protein BDW74DRAFT_69276 [Aspergillus multicolor]|uniref:uncharacterized protein n=1 Tax=Aspergillus multicolor TaxID=41759 RepID=UPI003CCCC86E
MFCLYLASTHKVSTAVCLEALVAGAQGDKRVQGCHYRSAGPKKRGDQVQVGFKISTASDSLNNLFHTRLLGVGWLR